MILRKVIDWISGNQKPSEELNQITVEEPEEENNSIINVDDDVVISSISRKDLLFVPGNNSDDNMPCSFETNNNINKNNSDDSFVTATEVAQNCPEDDCNLRANREIFPIEDSPAAEIPPVDSQICSIDDSNDIKEVSSNTDLQTAEVKRIDDETFSVNQIMATDSCDPVSNLRSFSIGTSIISLLPEKTSGVEFRNFGSQTDADLRRSFSIIKYSKKKNTSQRHPGHKQEIRPFSAATSTLTIFNNHSSSSRKKSEDSELIVYGVLYVFGCNKRVPEHLADKMNSKYPLRKRTKANGIKEAFSYVKSNEEPLCMISAGHVISYRLSNNFSAVVAYKHDSLSDMFQIGRCEESTLDFRVVDTNRPEKARNGVSRFACRILVRRDGIHEARVYAAAFDSSQTIFIGDNSTLYSNSMKVDGFTTNGVLIRHPGKKDRPSLWREVSASGYIYPLRSSQTELKKRSRLPEESNVLQDGTMIDLCGVTLLWRTPEGLKKAPNEEFLSRLQTTLHMSVPGLSFLMQRLRESETETKWTTKKAYVYISCGHVVGLTVPKLPENPQRWPCPICRTVGPLTELKIGAEPGFYMDREFPSHAFKPCGHAASLKTIQYWSSTQIPKHRSIQSSHCPFCGVDLNLISQYVKLILPTE